MAPAGMVSSNSSGSRSRSSTVINMAFALQQLLSCGKSSRLLQPSCHLAGFACRLKNDNRRRWLVRGLFAAYEYRAKTDENQGSCISIREVAPAPRNESKTDS